MAGFNGVQNSKRIEKLTGLAKLENLDLFGRWVGSILQIEGGERAAMAIEEELHENGEQGWKMSETKKLNFEKPAFSLLQI